MDDILLGSASASVDGADADDALGLVYAVYGQVGSAPVDLVDIENGGSSGFLVFNSSAPLADGTQNFDGLGFDVAGLGDINGDGIGDFVIASLSPDDQALANDEDNDFAYVVFGTNDGLDIDVNLIDDGGAGGFRITGNNNGSSVVGNGRDDRLGNVVSSAGDVNGDGFNDIAISAIGTDFDQSASYGNEGAVFILFGGTDISDVDAESILDGTINSASDRGYFIEGDPQLSQGSNGLGLASDIASIGDVNGDGLDDLLFSVRDSSTVTVIYGQEGITRINYADLAPTSITNPQGPDSSLGFIITGLNPSGFDPLSISSAGDFNGDGFADILINSLDFDEYAAMDEQTAFVIFGSNTITNVDASTIRGGGGSGFAVVNNGDLDTLFGLGTSLSAIGDINGDGFDDIAIGGPGATQEIYNPNAANYYDYINNGGNAFVIFGNDSGSTADVDIQALGGDSGGVVVFDSLGTDGDDVIDGFAQSEVLLGGRGNDTITGNGGSDILNLSLIHI